MNEWHTRRSSPEGEPADRRRKKPPRQGGSVDTRPVATARPTRVAALTSALTLLVLPLAACTGATAGQGTNAAPLAATAGAPLSAGASLAAAHPTYPPNSPIFAPTPVIAGGLHVVHSPNRVADDERQIAPGQCHVRTGAGGQPMPDPACTPGAIDPAITQADIATTICRSGYTSSVRPPTWNIGQWESVTASMYGIIATGGEYDHLIPLDLGGANASSNLWVEPGAIPNPKDAVEQRLHEDVCSGRMPLAAAQLAIATNWTTIH